MSNAGQWPNGKYLVRRDGSVFTPGDLPAPNTKRWVLRRKVEVVESVREGLITMEEACRQYALTMEEFGSWQSAFDRFGKPELARRAHRYRLVDRKAVCDPVREEQ